MLLLGRGRWRDAAGGHWDGMAEQEPALLAEPEAEEQPIPALLIEDSAVARHVFKHLEALDLLRGATLVCKQWRRHTKLLCAEWKQELLGESELSVSGLC